MMKTRYVLVFVCVTVVWVVLSIIGALGPPVNRVERFSLEECLISKDGDHINDIIVGRSSCKDHGAVVDRTQQMDSSKYINVKDIVFFVELPIKRTKRKMSRYNQFLIVDVDVALKSDYIKHLGVKEHDLLWYQVSLSYRNHDETNWNKLVSGNASRILQCEKTSWGTRACDHLPLFELWSSHYDHYLINLRVPFLPFTDRDFSGISAIKDMSVIVIHQDPRFTRNWFIMKSVFFVLSLLILLVYRSVLYNIQNKHPLNLLYCLIFLNGVMGYPKTFWGYVWHNWTYLLSMLPVEVISLYVNVPWMTVFNDFRHGLMIGSLCVYFTLFISQVANTDKDLNHLRHNWYVVLLIALSCVTLFVYEFCERGIQVIKPFYSIWGTHTGRYTSYVMVALAVTFSVLFLLCMIVKIVKVFAKIRKDWKEMTTNAKQQMFELVGFVILTTAVCLYSVIGYVLPMELYLFHWMHENRNLSLYGALLLSNYGLWNSYVFAVVVLYTRIKSELKILNKTSY